VGEKKTRYNELLDVPNHIRDPDLYQLLGLDRGQFQESDVDAAYKERMSKLQRIRSPKHKSFIEFLKGELRRGRTTLTNAKRREEYDEELLGERREQLTMILDVVLSDGVLSEIEEERLRSVAQDVGLFPAECERVIAEELSKRGAVRERDKPAAPPPQAAPPAQRPAPGPGPGHGASDSGVILAEPVAGSWGATFSTSQSGEGFFPTAAPVDQRPASDSDIQRKIQEKLRPPTRRPSSRPARPPSEEIVTAELVEEPAAPRRPSGKPASGRPQRPTGRRPGSGTGRPGSSGAKRPAARQQTQRRQAPPQQPPQQQQQQASWGQQQQQQQQAGWGQQAKPAKATGWGQASRVRQVGVCTGCLTPVTDAELTTGKAERFPDGRMHCPSCTNRLVAGLICARCYSRITRTDMKGRDLVIEGGRVSHGRCVRGR